jgi:hypothetical protein
MSRQFAQTITTASALESAASPTDGFVEFWSKGAFVAGRFACVSCGLRVRAVGSLPSCRECGCELWEDPSTSPFTEPRPELAGADAYQRWIQDDLRDTAGLLRGAPLAALTGIACWVALAAIAFAAVRLW